MMNVHDAATSAHGEDVASLAPRVGAFLGLDPAAIEELEIAARFHDIGKVAVPAEILRKAGPLDESEWRVMQRHADWGADLLAHLPGCEEIARTVRHHHERHDGRGYPDRLAGEEIPPASRIIAVCDAYGAMITDRPYRAALAQARAIAELQEGAGVQFDPAAVQAVIYVAGTTGGGLGAEAAAG
jgi:HD-GYP domain-containing protein (c-di-GMP phosphodiesterase class II)